jgi:hypothetical protein
MTAVIDSWAWIEHRKRATRESLSLIYAMAGELHTKLATGDPNLKKLEGTELRKRIFLADKEHLFERF